AEKPQLDADDLNILKGYDVATNGVTGALARLDYELSNNYYRNNKKSGILGRFEGWKKTTFNTLSQNSAKNMRKHSYQFSHNRKAG
ncbi:MAG: hypothetical protein J6N45_07540, partial [Alphaproteobacteria bacterium]|nr:hypothetical protein [Alphaproteobacteria bacterium]